MTLILFLGIPAVSVLLKHGMNLMIVFPLAEDELRQLRTIFHGVLVGCQWTENTARHVSFTCQQLICGLDHEQRGLLFWN